MSRLFPATKTINPNRLNPKGPPLDEIMQGLQSEFLQRVVFTLEEEKGYTDPDTTFRFAVNDGGDTTQVDTSLSTRYAGSPYRSYTRIRARYGNNFSFSLVGEKDPGETFQWDPENKQYGYDFLSGHLYFGGFGFLKSLAIGDYTMQFGQGLILSRGLGFGKGAEVTNSVKMPAHGIRPYSSVNENQFMRGAAATFGFGPVQLTAFYSRLNIDANLTDPDTLTNETAEIQSISLGGLHRTPSELARRKTIPETSYGGRLAFHTPTLKFGATVFQQQFETALNPPINEHNQFNFRGDENLLMSADVDWVFQNFNFFGEVARSSSGGIAATGGFMSSLSPTLDVSVVARSFGKDFHSFKGYAFAERPTAIQNERGVYLGVKVMLSRKWVIRSYFDQYYYPWNKFRASFPSKGHESLLQLDYRPNRNTLLYLRFRSDAKERNATEYDPGQQVSYLIPTRKDNFRIHFQHKLSRDLQIRNRLELAWYKQGNEEMHKGFLLYQDISWKQGFKFRLTGRYAIFDAPDWEARIYAYENDVLGFFSIPPYYRTGSRYYLNLNYKIDRHIEIWARFAQTRFHQLFFQPRDGDTYLPIGNQGLISQSSLESITGNTRSEIKLQLRVKF